MLYKSKTFELLELLDIVGFIVGMFLWVLFMSPSGCFCKTREIPISEKKKWQNRNFGYKTVISIKKSEIYSLDLG